MSCRSRARMAARDPQVVAYWERRRRLAWQNTGITKPVEPSKEEKK